MNQKLEQFHISRRGGSCKSNAFDFGADVLRKQRLDPSQVRRTFLKDRKWASPCTNQFLKGLLSGVWLAFPLLCRNRNGSELTGKHEQQSEQLHWPGLG
jgi:hypothetical protein